MRNHLLAAMFVVGGFLAGTGTAHATQVGYGKNLGVGLMFGDPTGITGKYWLSYKNAVDLGLGFGFYHRKCDRWGCYGGYDGLSVNADYLWQGSLARGQVELDWHAGIGGRIFFWDYDNRYRDHGGVLNVAARVPLGLDLMFNNPGNLEIFIELVPSLYMLDGVWLGFDASLGGRIYF